MPGTSHEALGFAKFYAMTSQAAKDPERAAAAWKFIEFMGGGDYRVAKRWAVEKGLGCAALPLFDDPDVEEARSHWINMDSFRAQAKLALNGTQTEWTGLWTAFFRPLLAKATSWDTTIPLCWQSQQSGPVRLQRQAQSEKFWVVTNGKFTVATNTPICRTVSAVSRCWSISTVSPTRHSVRDSSLPLSDTAPSLIRLSRV